MSVSPSQDLFHFAVEPLKDSLTQITTATSWQDKYRHIMLLGKQMPSLAKEFQSQEAQVKGCESQAWLYHSEVDGQHFFLVDSDARIVKGLAALVIAALQGKNGEEISAFDANQFFAQLGLSGQLSPSRTNGLTAMVKAMQTMASGK